MSTPVLSQPQGVAGGTVGPQREAGPFSERQLSQRRAVPSRRGAPCGWGPRQGRAGRRPQTIAGLGTRRSVASGVRSGGPPFSPGTFLMGPGRMVVASSF